MKFRDYKTGRVFHTKYEALSAFCEAMKFCCSECVFQDYEVCGDIVKNNPTESTRLMGYDVMEDDFVDATKIDEKDHRIK